MRVQVQICFMLLHRASDVHRWQWQASLMYDLSEQLRIHVRREKKGKVKLSLRLLMR